MPEGQPTKLPGCASDPHRLLLTVPNLALRYTPYAPPTPIPARCAPTAIVEGSKSPMNARKAHPAAAGYLVLTGLSSAVRRPAKPSCYYNSNFQ